MLKRVLGQIIGKVSFEMLYRSGNLAGWETTCRKGEELVIMGVRTWVLGHLSDTWRLDFAFPVLTGKDEVEDFLRDGEEEGPVLARMAQAMCARHCGEGCLAKRQNQDKEE